MEELIFKYSFMTFNEFFHWFNNSNVTYCQELKIQVGEKTFNTPLEVTEYYSQEET